MNSNGDKNNVLEIMDLQWAVDEMVCLHGGSLSSTAQCSLLRVELRAPQGLKWVTTCCSVELDESQRFSRTGSSLEVPDLDLTPHCPKLNSCTEAAETTFAHSTSDVSLSLVCGTHAMTVHECDWMCVARETKEGKHKTLLKQALAPG